MEYSLLLIKPDAVRLKLNNEILAKVAGAGLETVFRREMRLTPEQVQELYRQHCQKEFFPYLKDFMISGPCEVCVVRGENAIKSLDELCGHNDPEKAASGTLRRIYGTGKSENAVHSSSTWQSFEFELKLLLHTVNVSDLIAESG